MPYYECRASDALHASDALSSEYCQHPPAASPPARCQRSSTTHDEFASSGATCARSWPRSAGCSRCTYLGSSSPSRDGRETVVARRVCGTATRLGAASETRGAGGALVRAARKGIVGVGIVPRGSTRRTVIARRASQCAARYHDGPVFVASMVCGRPTPKPVIEKRGKRRTGARRFEGSRASSRRLW